MATTFSSSSADDRFDASGIARHVAADLESIFGNDRRAGTESGTAASPTLNAVPASRTGSRRALTALAGVGALGVMVLGGLTMGYQATNNAEAVAPARLDPIEAPAPSSAPARPVVALSAAALPVPPIDEVQSTRAPRSPLIQRAAPGARERIEQVAPVAQAPAPMPIRFDRRIDAPPVTVIPPRRASCDDTGDCGVSPLDQADRRVAAAYDQAIDAGVRNRDLRDYRSEWVRARARAARDPQGALRIYGMIAADLDTLAQDAVMRPVMANR